MGNVSSVVYSLALTCSKTDLFYYYKAVRAQVSPNSWDDLRTRTCARDQESCARCSIHILMSEAVSRLVMQISNEEQKDTDDNDDQNSRYNSRTRTCIEYPSLVPISTFQYP